MSQKKYVSHERGISPRHLSRSTYKGNVNEICVIGSKAHELLHNMNISSMFSLNSRIKHASFLIDPRLDIHLSDQKPLITKKYRTGGINHYLISLVHILEYYVAIIFHLIFIWY